MVNLNIMDIKELSLDGINALSGEVLTLRELDALQQNELVELTGIYATTTLNKNGDTIDTYVQEFAICQRGTPLAIAKVKGLHTIEEQE